MRAVIRGSLSIVLAFSFLFSGIIILIPSHAQAVTETWNQTSGNLASTDANWLDTSAPTTGADVIFDGTSVADCTWDLGLSLTSFSMNSGYSGTVSQTTGSITTTGDFTVAAGTFTGGSGYGTTVTVAGDFIHSAGSITNNNLALILTGEGKTVRTTTTLKDCTFSNNITISTSSVAVRHSLTVDAGKTVTVPVGTGLNWQTIGGGTFTNNGIIAGTSLFYVFNYNVNATISFGVMTIAGVQVTLQSGGTANTLTLGAPASFPYSTFKVSSLQAGQAQTLDLSTNNYALSAVNLEILDGGVIRSRNATITCTGNWDSSAGTFDAGTSKLVMAGTSSRTLKTGVGQNLYDVRFSGPVSTLSDVGVSHNLTIDSGKTLTIGSTFIFDYNCSATGIYTNNGFIGPPGTMYYSFSTVDKTIDFGTLNSDVRIRAISTATANRTLTIGDNTRFGRALLLDSDHATNWMIFDARLGNVSVVMGFTNGTRGMVYYTYWVESTPYTYGIYRNVTDYYAKNMISGMIEYSENATTGYADATVQYAVNNSYIGGHTHFFDGTFIFNTTHDFYVGGWNYSVIIDGAYDFNISGETGAILKFRDDVKVASGKGVVIFYVTGTTEILTFESIDFESGPTLSNSYESAIFFYQAIVQMRVLNCSFTGLNWSIWGDGTEFGAANDLGNEYMGNTFADTWRAMALHNIQSGTLIQDNSFSNAGLALMIDSVNNVLVTGNTFLSCNIEGIYVFDNCNNITIINNRFTGGIGVVVAQVSGKQDTHNVSIIDNFLVDMDYGIVVQGGNDTIVTGNIFKAPIAPIIDNGTDSIVNSNANYTFKGSTELSAVMAGGHLLIDDYMRFSITCTNILVNITIQNFSGSVFRWSINTTDTINFTFSNLGDNSGFRFYADDVRIGEGYGPSFTFGGTGNQTYYLMDWYPRSVSMLLPVIFIVLATGIIASICATMIFPYTGKRQKKQSYDVSGSIKMVIVIIIALAFLGIIGGMIFA